MKTLNYDTTVIAYASDGDELNKYLRRVKFIFLDDQPNINKQVVSHEEFESIKKSAIHMPIKMRFLGSLVGPANHNGAIPIGHITSVEEEEAEGTHRLIGDGVLYAEAFPEIMDYLDDKFEKGEAPGISFEIGYKEEIVEKGLKYIKDLTAVAAAFVRNPAYGKRTALLALASDETLTDAEIDEGLTSLLSKEEPKGGTNKVDLEQALQRIKDLEKELADKTEEGEKLATAADDRIKELTDQNLALAEEVNEFKQSAVIAERTQKLAVAGLDLDTDAEELAKKQRVWASMSEEAFDLFVSGISSVAKKPEKKDKVAIASARTPVLPRVTTEGGNGQVSYEDLRNKMKSLSSRNAGSEE